MAPKKMWFGNTNHFQWVPAPSSGVGVSNVGVVDQLNYQNGRAGVVRTMQSHKEFDFEFPVQEASGLDGLDVYNKYASGFYGDLDSYPLFFANPMDYDQNLFPPGWASPGLYARGWASIVESGAKTYYNHALNPSVEVDDVGYFKYNGTGGGVSTGARVLTTTAVSGNYAYRQTWTTASSNVSGGVSYQNTPVIEGLPYDFSIYIRPGNTDQRVRLSLEWRNNVDAVISTVLGTETVILQGSSVQLSILNASPPTGAVTVDLVIDAVPGTSAVNWAIGHWLQIDAVMINWSHQASPTYFDGDTPGAGWQGTIGASTSVKYVARNIPVISPTPTNSYNLPPVQCTWNVMSTANGYPTTTNTYGEIPYAILPIPPGYVLWLGATGSATGTAELVVEVFDPTPTITPLTLLDPTASVRLNFSVSGDTWSYARVYVRRTSTAVSTITLSSLVAQLWPVGVTPNVNGNFIEGKGHRGLKFADNATVESYVMVDLQRNTPVHYKGMSTRLVEAQDKG